MTTKKLYYLILLLFVVTLCGCSNEGNQKPKTLIYDSDAPLPLYGSISLNTQLKTADATSLWELQKLPLAGVFPMKSYLSKQVALAFSVEPTKTPEDSIETSAKPNTNKSHVIIDATGYFTTFTEAPSNVAVLCSSYAQAWQDAGGVVSITVQESIDRGLVKSGFANILALDDKNLIDAERLLQLRPDLVILTYEEESQIALADTLRDNGIKTLVLKVDNFLDYLSMLKAFTNILNTSDRYQTYGTEVLNEVEGVIEDTSAQTTHPNILLLSARLDGLKVLSEKHFVFEMLHEMQAVNIATDAMIQSTILSPEILLTAKIDQIYIILEDAKSEEVKSFVEQEFATHPAYQTITAIKEHHYYFLPKEWFTYQPNKNWGKAYEYLSNLLYPKEMP